MPSWVMTALMVLGGLTALGIAAVVIGAVLNYFIFEPQRERVRKEEYETVSRGGTGPFWIFDVLFAERRRREHPIISVEARQHQQLRLLQFILLLVLLGVGGLLIKMYLL